MRSGKNAIGLTCNRAAADKSQPLGGVTPCIPSPLRLDDCSRRGQLPCGLLPPQGLSYSGQGSDSPHLQAAYRGAVLARLSGPRSSALLVAVRQSSSRRTAILRGG
jgi:hypothetical protein